MSQANPMFEKLEQVSQRFAEIESQIVEPAVVADRDRYTKLMREHSELADVVGVYQQWRTVAAELTEAEALAEDGDAEMREMAAQESRQLSERKAELDAALRKLLVPKDPMERRNAILEIRAGTGGEEAALFAGDLLRMYGRYAEEAGFRMEPLSLSSAAKGGVKDVVVMVVGRDAFGRLRYEGGVHRVQRVPETETQGRIHTSTVTVAVLPEAEDVDVHIEEKDVRVDVYRSSGPGGQSVNTTDSAVRLTHVPSGLVVTCQDEKSQHKNKAKAMKILRSRVFEMEESKRLAEIDADRKAMVGTGDRSERIRTYNFPQGRVTDHRLGLTKYSLETFLQGNIDEYVDALRAHFQAAALEGGSSR